MKEGILIGADKHQEWLLPWWWKRYRRWNDHPVALIDFGLSEKMLSWAQSRFQLLPAANLSLEVAEKKAFSPEQAKRWQKSYPGPFWQARKIWFKKPLALSLFPFEQTLWLDIDCEVLGSITPLFSYCDSLSGIGLAPEPISAQEWMRDHGFLLPGEILYNSGVVVVRRHSPLILHWAKEAVEGHQFFSGDQELLSRLIHQHRYQINELPPVYNWRMSQGFVLEAVIIHWVTAGGKRYVRQRGGLGPLIERERARLKEERFFQLE
jgi:hypothetical protein